MFWIFSELIEDESELGEENYYQLLKCVWTVFPFETVGDHKMDLKWDGGYELFFDKNPKN